MTAIILSAIEQRDRRGVSVIARDDGPGIQDVELVGRPGTSPQGRYQWVR